MSKMTLITGRNYEIEEWYDVDDRLPRSGDVVIVRGSIIKHEGGEQYDVGSIDDFPGRTRLCQYLGKTSLMPWQVIGPYYYVAWVEGVVRWKPVLDQFGAKISYSFEDYPTPSSEEQRRIIDNRYQQQMDAINEMSTKEFNAFWAGNTDRELEKRWSQHNA